VATTTISAAVMSILIIYLPMTRSPATSTTGWVDTGVTTGLLACIVMVIGGSAARWIKTLRGPVAPDMHGAGGPPVAVGAAE